MHRYQHEKLQITKKSGIYDTTKGYNKTAVIDPKIETNELTRVQKNPFLRMFSEL